MHSPVLGLAQGELEEEAITSVLNGCEGGRDGMWDTRLPGWLADPRHRSIGTERVIAGRNLVKRLTQGE